MMEKVCVNSVILPVTHVKMLMRTVAPVVMSLNSDIYIKIHTVNVNKCIIKMKKIFASHAIIHV